MGTRGAVGFVVKGEEKLAYNHWDSYPSGLGVETLRWLREVVRDRPEWLLDRVLNLHVIGEDEKPTPEIIEQLAPYTDLGVSNQSTDDWYCLLRHCQGDLQKTLEAGYIEASNDFPLDSLFCEWAYVIDLDANTFEVYQGFQKQPPAFGRWVDADQDSRAAKQGYYPVNRVAVWPLTDLPTDDELCNFESNDQD